MERDEILGDLGMNFMIGATGLLMVIPLFFYSTYLHTRRMKVKKDEKAFMNTITCWLLLCYVPMAIIF